MNITFEWKEFNGAKIPISRSELESDQGSDLLSNILMDDGGLPLSNSIEWCEVALKHISLVSEGSVESYDWDRETWYATITPNWVTIYSVLDENCSLDVTTALFRRVVAEWLVFLQSEPSADKRRVCCQS